MHRNYRGRRPALCHLEVSLEAVWEVPVYAPLPHKGVPPPHPPAGDPCGRAKGPGGGGSLSRHLHTKGQPVKTSTYETADSVASLVVKKCCLLESKWKIKYDLLHYLERIKTLMHRNYRGRRPALCHLEVRLEPVWEASVYAPPSPRGVSPPLHPPAGAPCRLKGLLGLCAGRHLKDPLGGGGSPSRHLHTKRQPAVLAGVCVFVCMSACWHSM